MSVLATWRGAQLRGVRALAMCFCAWVPERCASRTAVRGWCEGDWENLLREARRAAPGGRILWDHFVRVAR